MKNYKHILFSLSFVALLAASCGSNAKTLEPSFKNYTSDDICSKDDFETMVYAKDYEMGFNSFNYVKSSYQIESSETYVTQTTYQYEKGTVSNKVTNRYNTAKLYNHHNDVIVYDTSNTVKGEGPGANDNVSVEQNFVFQMNEDDVVVADKNTKLYQVIKTLPEGESFSNYVGTDHALSASYIYNTVSYHTALFSSFVLSDQPLVYYFKKNLFTIGLSYKDKNIPEANEYYQETLSVSAVCQINVTKTTITANVRYDITDIKTNFSEAYISTNHIDYSKVTVNRTLSKVVRLTINGTMLADAVELTNYSLGNVNY